MVKSIDMVGSSTLMRGMASAVSMSLMVSPISKPSIPVMAQMSPEKTSSVFFLPMPSKVKSSFTFTCFETMPWSVWCIRSTICPCLMLPR